MISVEEEVNLTVRIKNGDTKALEKLVVANLRFVVSVAKQYQNKGLSFSDLINEGNIGLVKAATKFDETKGFKFISYAVWWIRQSITQAISEKTRLVRLPINKLSSISKITKAIPYLEQEFEREPTNREIADYLELKEEEISTASYISKRQISFDAPIYENSESEINLYDIIQTSSIPSPDHDIMKESCSININRALNKLSKREASILTMSFGLGNSPSHTLHDIAIKYEMTSERVRQIRSRGLHKLKTMLNGNYTFLD